MLEDSCRVTVDRSALFSGINRLGYKGEDSQVRHDGRFLILQQRNNIVV